jgi:hypothetical protein
MSTKAIHQAGNTSILRPTKLNRQTSVSLARPTEFIGHQFDGFDQPALLTLALKMNEQFLAIVRWHDHVTVFTVPHHTNSLPWSSMRPIVMR